VSHLAYRRMALRIVATLAASVVLAACGYKGPLYLPGQGPKGPASNAKTSTSPAPAHAPVPADPQLP
jgi:predicted small lipoprotein YifL